MLGYRRYLCRQVASGLGWRAGKKPTIDHTITAVPLELRGGYTGYWRVQPMCWNLPPTATTAVCLTRTTTASILRATVLTRINQFALDYLDQYTGEKPFFMTVSQIEPHHQE